LIQGNPASGMAVDQPAGAFVVQAGSRTDYDGSIAGFQLSQQRSQGNLQRRGEWAGRWNSMKTPFRSEPAAPTIRPAPAMPRLTLLPFATEKICRFFVALGPHLAWLAGIVE
jgi:hypothetical protein